MDELGVTRAMVTGVLQQQATEQSRQLLVDMHDSNDDTERKRLKEEFDKQLGNAGVQSIEEKERIAKTGSAALDDGELTINGMAKIISDVVRENNSRVEGMRLRFSNTAFSEISNSLTRTHDSLAAEFAGASPEVIRQFNSRFEPELFSSDEERRQGAVKLIRQLTS